MADYWDREGLPLTESVWDLLYNDPLYRFIEMTDVIGTEARAVARVVTIWTGYDQTPETPPISTPLFNVCCPPGFIDPAEPVPEPDPPIDPDAPIPTPVPPPPPSIFGTLAFELMVQPNYLMGQRIRRDGVPEWAVSPRAPARRYATENAALLGHDVMVAQLTAYFTRIAATTEPYAFAYGY